MPNIPFKDAISGGRLYLVFNLGPENTPVFRDEQDFNTFLDYLKGYLTDIKDQERIKQTFVIKGQIFKGVPHQAKNYFGRIGLIAYALTASGFQLVICEKSDNSLKSFIQSLSTRYSLYFNKKYSHTGKVFDSSSKTQKIEDSSILVETIKLLHQKNEHSSYKEYVGERITPWMDTVPTEEIRANESIGYQDHIEREEIREKENQVTSMKQEVGVKSSLASDATIYYTVTPYGFNRVLAATIAFVVLFIIGLNNVRSTSAGLTKPEILGIQTPLSSPPPTFTPLPTLTPYPTPILAKPTAEAGSASATSKDPEDSTMNSVSMVVSKEESVSPDALRSRIATISLPNVGLYIDIRQYPDRDATIIGVAKNGDTFDVVGHVNDWYELLIDENTHGFILAEYIRVTDI